MSRSLPSPLALSPRRPAAVAWPQAEPAAAPAIGHLPYEYYQLANGLRVVLHPYTAAPLVHVEVTYHVGSGHDTPGCAGLAHFCEHLMFEGSQHVAAGEHQRRIKAAGGTANALTDRDHTSYYQTAPAPELELLLWLEADRMGFLVETLTPEAVETQRAVILQERTQTYDERPFGRAAEYVGQALYPAGHPYGWVPIGTRAGITDLTLADIQDFFRRWYIPANATLTIGGDFEPAGVRQWLSRYFGSLPSHPAPARRPALVPVLTQPQRLVVAEAVQLPLVQLTLPTVPRHHSAEVALDALAELIGVGKNSLLFQRLVRTQQAVQVAATHTTSELSGELTLSIVGQPGASLAALEQAAWAALRDAGQPAGLPDALLRFANRREAVLLGKLDNLAERVRQLADYEWQLGQPDYLPTYLASLHALRPADVQRAHATYLLDQSAVVLQVLSLTDLAAIPTLPSASATLATPVRAQRPVLSPPPLPPVIDDFDRRVAPASAPARPALVPDFWRDQLRNGLQLIGAGSSAIPVLTLVLGLPGGRCLEQGPTPGNPAQPAGLAALTAALLNEGSRRYASPEFTAALNRLGSTVHATAGFDQTTVYVQTLAKHLRPTLALLEERLLHPRFDEADFARLQRQTLQGLAQQNTQGPALADRLFAQCLRAPADVLGQPLAGTLASVSALRLSDVRAFYDQAYGPVGAVLAIAGDQGRAQLDPYLGFLRGWEAGAVLPAFPVATPPLGHSRQLYFLHKAGAQQSELRVGYLGLPFDATGEYYRATLVSFLLGGSPSSRLAQRLRHRHGYAYSVRAGFTGLRCPGPFTIQAAVRPEVTAATLVAIDEEIAALHAGVSDEECWFLQTSLRQLDARRYETNQQRASWLLHLAQHALPADYVLRQHTLLRQLRPHDVAAFATRHLPLERLQTVVVGDGPRVLPALRADGHAVVEMTLNVAGELVAL